MKSRESMVAKQVRLKQWAKQVQSCNNRPTGMTVDEWCTQNNITKANYYWRMKQVRIACLDAVEQSGCDFVELPVSLKPTTALSVINPGPVVDKTPSAATIRTGSGLSIELFETASAEFIQKLIGALAYVK